MRTILVLLLLITSLKAQVFSYNFRIIPVCARTTDYLLPSIVTRDRVSFRIHSVTSNPSEVILLSTAIISAREVRWPIWIFPQGCNLIASPYEAVYIPLAVNQLEFTILSPLQQEHAPPTTAYIQVVRLKLGQELLSPTDGIRVMLFSR